MRFKVQIVALFSGEENLGVFQTLQHGASNQVFLDDTASFLHKRKGSVRNGDIIGEPGLNPGSRPFTRKSWNLKYKDGKVSFADAPGTVKGAKGYIDFVTTFYSNGKGCVLKKCATTWRWQVDFIEGKNVNSVRQLAQPCTW